MPISTPLTKDPGKPIISKDATEVFPVSICLRLGLYAELFLFIALGRLAEMAKKKSLFGSNVAYFFAEKWCSRKYRVSTRYLSTCLIKFI